MEVALHTARLVTASAGHLSARSPRDVEMVRFNDDFLRARTARGDALRVGRPSNCSSTRSCDCEIDSASSDVERVLDATHALVVLRRTATASDTYSGMTSEQASEMQSGMSG